MGVPASALFFCFICVSIILVKLRNVLLKTRLIGINERREYVVRKRKTIASDLQDYCGCGRETYYAHRLQFLGGKRENMCYKMGVFFPVLVKSVETYQFMPLQHCHELSTVVTFFSCGRISVENLQDYCGYHTTKSGHF